MDRFGKSTAFQPCRPRSMGRLGFSPAGTFTFYPVPLGEYTVTVANPGFVQTAQDVIVKSGTDPVLHYQLKLAVANESVTVSAAPQAVPTDSATPTTLVSRADVARTPGASR